MTLVIAGQNYEEGIEWDENKSLEKNGLFIASDSTITANGATILSGFRKTYSIPVKVWKPSFLGVYFHGYNHLHYESECFIAIAGSTLTAQHVINCISDHLNKLRISYERSESLKNPSRYIVIRHCQTNILTDNTVTSTWGEDMFTSDDFTGIITAEVISSVIEYSVNEALSSALKYKLDEKSLSAMYTEFAAGVYCPLEKKEKLYFFKMDKKVNSEGVYEVFTTKEEVPSGKLIVLGMRDRFGSQAQKVFDDALNEGKPPANKIYDFLNEAIDTVTAEGDRTIDRPSVLISFKTGQLTKVKFTR